MADRYQQLVNTPIGQIVAKQVGLPQPAAAGALRARPAGDRRPGAARRGAGLAPGRAAGKRAGGDRRRRRRPRWTRSCARAAAAAKLDAGIFNPDAAPADAALQGARVRRHRDRLQRRARARHGRSLHPAIRRVLPSGRVIVLGTPPEDCAEPGGSRSPSARSRAWCARSARRSSKGATAQLVYVAPKAEGQLESTLRFFLSPKSAFVSGQVVRIGPARRAAGRRSTGTRR